MSKDEEKLRSGRKTVALGGSEEAATAESEVKPPRATLAGDERAEPSPVRVASPTSALPASGSTIVSLWPGKLKVVCPSGAVYIWEKPGTSRLVAAEDVENVMGRNSDRRACCGGSSARIYFRLAE